MENKRTTVVSIIMATYNRSHLIAESIDAILNLTYCEWECLIIDDGSTDATSEVLSKLASQDPRIKYHKRTPEYLKGLPGCRNYGLDRAKGDQIVFFDDDDIPHPKLLEIALFHLNHSKASFCRYGRTVFRGDFKPDFDHSEEYKVEPLPGNITELMITGKIPFNSCQILWSKSCFDEVRFNEQLLFAEEWECYTRILLAGHRGIAVHKDLYFGRKHEQSNTGEFQKKDSTRINSKIHAAILIIDHLHAAQKINKPIKKFFIRMAFDLKSLALLDKTLNASDSKLMESVKYKSGLRCYALIRPFLKLKGKLKSV